MDYGTVAGQQNGAAGGFIAAAALHADIAVFHFVQAANAVATAHLVQVRQHLGRAHLLAVDGHDIAFGVAQLNDLGLARRLFRADSQAPHVFFGSEVRVFKNAAFIADVQQIGIH